MIYSQVSVVGCLCGLAVTVLYGITKSWVANNFVALMLCVVTLGSVRLGNIKWGVLLLWLLFFYDIFWVFATDVMETVARSVDAPILLLFPRSLSVPFSLSSADGPMVRFGVLP